MPTQNRVQPKIRAAVGSFAAVIAFAGAMNAQANEIAYTAEGHPYVKGEMLVKVRSKAAFERMLARSQESLGALGVRQAVQETANGSWFKVKVDEKLGSVYTSNEVRNSEGVLFAEPNFIYTTQIGGRPGTKDPNGGPDYNEIPELGAPTADPRMNDLYGLERVDAETAWAVTRGSRDIVVGNIDTGIDYNHPDLINNAWRNAAEVPGNGIDDDKNGYVDDIVGWDFRDKDARPFDDNSHGSHTGGTIGATGGNGVGISGVAQEVSVMGLRFLGGSNGSGTSEDAIGAVEYATENGARLTNNSWGGGGFSQALFDAIEKANRKGVLFIAAAGNAGSDNDATPTYPANYELDNIITVAASDRNDRLGGFSNYGKDTVDIAAPGVKILSTIPGGGYRAYDGTSMAAPHVSGAAALILAAYPQLNGSQLKDLLLKSVDTIDGLSDTVTTGGRLNVAKAFTMARTKFGAPSAD